MVEERGGGSPANVSVELDDVGSMRGEDGRAETREKGVRSVIRAGKTEG